jgi:prepilin-type N-terminal cleavage/methylation domain-containing protein
MNIGLSRNHGFTLVEIMVVTGIIVLLTAIAIPNYVRSRDASQAGSCINNLRLIDSAKHQWAVENGKTDTDLPDASDVALYMKNNLFPSCPANGTYTLNIMNTDPTCNLKGHALPDP